MSLDEMLVALSSSNLRSHFPLVDLTSIFGAAAATLWQSSEFDRNEMMLIGEHNRPDLIEHIFKKAFLIDESFVGVTMSLMGKKWFSLPTMEATELPWENDDLRIFTRDHYLSIACIIFESSYERRTVFIMYFDIASELPNEATMNSFVKIGEVLINTFWEDHRAAAEDRRKIGHEIGRFLNACGQAVEVLEKKEKIRPAKRDKLFRDIKESILAARAACENETFVEGVIARKEKASSIELSRRITSVARSINDRNDTFSNTINIPDSMVVLINSSDFDLMISNIVENAEKYSTSRAYVVRGTTDGKGFRLWVSNPSVLLDNADLEKIWRYKHRGSNSGDQPGSGIGLTVVKDICKAYNIGHNAWQDERNGRRWMHVVLDFPSEICRTKIAWGQL